MLRTKKFLLPDHVGGRIRDGFKERGFDVAVLKDRHWYPLPDRIRILCVADYNQDAIILVDVGGSLIVNLNDAGDHGWGNFIRRIIRGYKVSFHLRLTGYGDTDMINYWREDGSFMEPRAARKRPVGKTIANLTREWGTRYFIPFSSMHVYERSDTAWARQYSTPLAESRIGFRSGTSELLPAFIRYDTAKHNFEKINPRPRVVEPIDPEEFGDDWSERLEFRDKEKITRYFKAVAHLEDVLDFINIRVGGEDNVVELAGKRFNRGLTFEAPRTSLMIAIENEIFDDMLIGNFMRIIVHGKFPPQILYPDFTPYVTKYADNGQAKSHKEVRRYFREYRMRAPLGYLRHRIASGAVSFIRDSFETDSKPYTAGARTYHFIKGLRIAR